MNMVLAVPKQQQALVAVTLWDWWTTRNKINAGEKRKMTEDICHLIVKHYHEFTPKYSGRGLAGSEQMGTATIRFCQGQL
jgi:hypothetical protein